MWALAGERSGRRNLRFAAGDRLNYCAVSSSHIAGVCPSEERRRRNGDESYCIGVGVLIEVNNDLISPVRIVRKWTVTLDRPSLCRRRERAQRRRYQRELSIPSPN